MRKEQLEELEAYLRKPGMAEANPGLKIGEIYGMDVIDDTARPAKPHKYHAKPTEYNGRRYPSKKHAQYAADLTLRQKAGEVWFWLEEVPFRLPGNTTHRVDFMVFYERQDYIHTKGSWALVEVKGRDLPMGRLKRKQVEEIYHVKVTVV